MKRTIKKIEAELTELYPKKELAYIDYTDNRGDSETAEQLYDEFKVLRDEWNSLVAERKELLKKESK